MNKIEWTDKTWNVITGCTQVSPEGWDSVVFHTDMLGHIFNFSKYPSGCKVFVNSKSGVISMCL